MSRDDAHNTVVTGYGCVVAGGNNAQSAYASLEEGGVCNQAVGKNIFPEAFIAPCFRVEADSLHPFESLESGIELEKTGINRTILLALTAIEEALFKAEITLAELRERRVGIVLGTTVGCSFHNEEYYISWKLGERPDPSPLINYFSTNLAARIQKILGVTGPRLVITNACASGTDAIGVAKSWLQYGLCDIALAGGADELSRIACHGFKGLMLVSEKSCTPFDRNRQGLNIGEGAGILVMEKELGANVRQAPIQGWVCGYGIAGDAYHPTAPHPEGKGLQLAVTKAMHEAGVTMDEISMINAHGTGTQANDLAETNALAILGFDEEKVPVVSTKGATGHTLGAAGGVEAVFTLMALNRGSLSGTIGCKEVDSAFSFKVLQEGQRATLKGRIGLSQSLAFGGSNGALVLQGAGR